MAHFIRIAFSNSIFSMSFVIAITFALTACSPKLKGTSEQANSRFEIETNFGNNGFAQFAIPSKPGYNLAYPQMNDFRVLDTASGKLVIGFGSILRQYENSSRVSIFGGAYEFSGFLTIFNESGERAQGEWKFFDFNDLTSMQLSQFNYISDVFTHNGMLYVVGTGASQASTTNQDSDTDIFIAKINPATGMLDTTWGDLVPGQGNLRRGIVLLNFGTNTTNGARAIDSVIEVIQRTPGSLMVWYRSNGGRAESDYASQLFRFELDNGVINFSFGGNGTLSLNNLISQFNELPKSKTIFSNGSNFENVRLLGAKDRSISGDTVWESFAASVTEAGINTSFGDNGIASILQYPKQIGGQLVGAARTYPMTLSNGELFVATYPDRRALPLDRLYWLESNGQPKSSFGAPANPGYVTFNSNPAQNVYDFVFDSEYDPQTQTLFTMIQRSIIIANITIFESLVSSVTPNSQSFPAPVQIPHKLEWRNYNPSGIFRVNNLNLIYGVGYVDNFTPPPSTIGWVTLTAVR